MPADMPYHNNLVSLHICPYVRMQNIGLILTYSNWNTCVTVHQMSVCMVLTSQRGLRGWALNEARAGRKEVALGQLVEVQTEAHQQISAGVQKTGTAQGGVQLHLRQQGALSVPQLDQSVTPTAWDQVSVTHGPEACKENLATVYASKQEPYNGDKVVSSIQHRH